MSEQQQPDPMTEESDGEILRIDSVEWSTVEFFRSDHDGSLCIEIEDAEQTWLTVDEAQQLRDWLIKVLP